MFVYKTLGTVPDADAIPDRSGIISRANDIRGRLRRGVSEVCIYVLVRRVNMCKPVRQALKVCNCSV